MSYSFQVTAPTKAAAKAAVAAKLDEVVASQAIHARDKAAALANANAAIDLLVDDASSHVAVSCNGCVGWREVLREDVSNDLHSASLSSSASLVAPPAT
ncbi:hypothetical protein [Bradyrhizobium sp. 153]|uniref:hypothetical protein n=1 Tax=Bradyrhizobium sp. 153 TaxID=2782627 RepID=UPI001FFAED8F|nr:hypothetical protein [Bradyrhizobium sp. 153]MCK1669452.1 hypothetical protein [Bradyrhizobium sp. 153]